MAGTTHNQALVERLLDDLGKLMWTMVWDVADSNRWQLDPEEVHAELCLELVKVVNKYDSKPYDEMKRLSVTSMRNRVHDLATACYLTNRKAESIIQSMDADDEDDGSSELAFDNTRGGGLESVFDIDEFCYGMSSDARRLVLEILYPSDRTGYHIKLTASRKRYLNSKDYWTLTITPLIMARGLGWHINRLRKAWKEVGDVLRCADHQNTL